MSLTRQEPMLWLSDRLPSCQGHLRFRTSCCTPPHPLLDEPKHGGGGAASHHAREGPVHGEVWISGPLELAVVNVAALRCALQVGWGGGSTRVTRCVRREVRLK